MTKAAEAFRTISEVADELDLQKHVLRFWEVKFPQIKPMKRGGGRRYYRPADLDLLRGIRHLLHAEGYTIKGVQRILRDRGIDTVKRLGVHLAEKGPTINVRELLEDDRAPDRIDAGAAKAETTNQPPVGGHGPGTRSDTRNARRGAARASTRSDIDRAIKAAIAELEACRAILDGIEPTEAVNVLRKRRSSNVSR
ncbi:MAG: MerR family transcriptional regulator [Hyphomicrobiaceae bacterium]|nr:MerR family transcriptional regulator [Hyphomicrobiaceae bacterium]